MLRRSLLELQETLWVRKKKRERDREIKTDTVALLLFHGVSMVPQGPVYRVPKAERSGARGGSVPQAQPARARPSSALCAG